MITIRYDGKGDMYVKLFYKIRNWRWFHDPPTRDMFIWLLLHANRKDEEWEGIIIHRGQRVTSYERMAEDLGFSIMQLRTAEKKLKSTGEITVKIYPKYQVISIVNFDRYQPDNRQNNRQVTGKQQASNNNKRDIENEENIRENISALAEEDDEPPIGSPEWLKLHYDD